MAYKDTLRKAGRKMDFIFTPPTTGSQTQPGEPSLSALTEQEISELLMIGG